MKTRGIVAYGAPFNGDTSWIPYYLSQNFTLYPWQDGSNGYTSELAAIVTAYKAAGGVVFGPTYGWGYSTQFYNLGRGYLATLYPNEQEFYLQLGPPLVAQGKNGTAQLSVGTATGFPGFSQGQAVTIAPNTSKASSNTIATAAFNSGIWALTLVNPLPFDYGIGQVVSNGSGKYLNPAISYATPGIVIDAPELKAEWLWMYGQIDANVGLQNLVGIAGWLNSDHPIQFGGASGADGGHNRNTYVRFAQSTYILQDIASGVHRLDGSACLILPYANQQASFGASTCQPSIAEAKDLSTYHHTPMTDSTGRNPGSSFSSYCVNANLNLEYSFLQAVQAKTQAFARTAMPLSVLNGTPYGNSLLEIPTASIYDIRASTPTLLQICYMNYSNPGDNGSNPGRTGIVEIATPATVTYFWTTVVPAMGNTPYVEADTDKNYMVAQAAATGWVQYATNYGKLALMSYEPGTPTRQNFDLKGWFVRPRGVDDQRTFPIVNEVIVNMLTDKPGGVGGKKQLWLSNPSENSRTVRYYLPAKQHDLVNPENVTDLVSDRTVYTGSRDIELKVSVPAKRWVLLDFPSMRNL